MNDLRTWDPAMFRRQYQAGVLTSGLVPPPGVPAKRVDCCPVCSCFKSGDALVANSKDDWCEVDECLCHRDDEHGGEAG